MSYSTNSLNLAQQPINLNVAPGNTATLPVATTPMTVLAPAIGVSSPSCDKFTPGSGCSSAATTPNGKPSKECNSKRDYGRAFWQGVASPVTNIFANKANLFTAAGISAAGLGLMALNRPLAEKLAAPLGWGVGAVQVLMGAKAYLGARNEKEMCEAMEGIGLAAAGLGLAALPSLMKSLEHKMGQSKGLGPLASIATLLVLVDPLLDLLSLNTLLNKKKTAQTEASPMGQTPSTVLV